MLVEARGSRGWSGSATLKKTKSTPMNRLQGPLDVPSVVSECRPPISSPTFRAPPAHGAADVQIVCESGAMVTTLEKFRSPLASRSPFVMSGFAPPARPAASLQAPPPPLNEGSGANEIGRSLQNFTVVFGL
jgi:hypothetical protein